MAGLPGTPWIAFALALVTRLYRLTHQSLWVDEIFTHKAIRYVRDVDPGHLLHDLHGPLYTAVGAVAAQSFSGEWLRLVSALAGALTVFPLYAWVSSILDRKTASWAAYLAALSPFAVWYGQELRNYSFVLLFSALCLWLFERWREQGFGLRGLAPFVLTAWCGLLSNQTFLLFLVGLGLASCLCARERRLRAAGWLSIAALLVILLSLPWIVSFVNQMAPQRLVVDMPAWDEAPLRGDSTFNPMAIPYTFHALLAGFSFGPSLLELHMGTATALKAHLPALLLAGLLFAAAGGRGFLALSAHRKLEFAVLILVVLFLASFLAMKNFKVYNVRYVSMLWPLLILLLARGITAQGRPFLVRAYSAGLPIIFMLALAQHYWNPAYGKEDLRAAAHQFEAEPDEVGLIVVAVVSESFQHYYRGEARVESLWPGMAAGQIASKLDSWGEPESFSLVSARPWEWGGESTLLETMPAYVAEIRAKLQGVTIYTMKKVL